MDHTLFHLEDTITAEALHGLVGCVNGSEVWSCLWRKLNIKKDKEVGRLPKACQRGQIFYLIVLHSCVMKMTTFLGTVGYCTFIQELRGIDRGNCRGVLLIG
jgi:hypothetical protein